MHPSRGTLASAAALALLAAPAASAQSGGMQFVPTPEISKVSCAKGCAGKRARAGGRIRVSGRNLSNVTKVTFHGARGRGDDVSVRVRPRGDRRITVRVPISARSGPLSALAGNVRSRKTKRIAVLPPPPPVANADLSPVPGPRDPGAPRLETGTSHVKWFVGSERKIALLYRVTDSGPVDVQVQLVRASDGAVVRSWERPLSTPGEVHRVNWDGFDAAGAVPPEGRYVFRVAARGANGAQARSAQTQDVRRDAFDLYRHIFPVRGRHDFGGENAHFGAGRHGHSHQGQDVFARCGTRLVAARGGVVKFEEYHAAAGHYLVIDGDQTDVDYAYMHLVSASPFDVGDRVHTGQQIGQVGDSGNASGCHLHFEMWSAPGWYDGGQPFDPYPLLTAWDAYS